MLPLALHICIVDEVMLEREAPQTVPVSSPCVALRAPTVNDAASIWRLIGRCPPLDKNTLYAYLLLADHHRETCVVAEREGKIVGFVSSYLLPATPGALFIWQVAVDQTVRGEGLAVKMIGFLLRRQGLRHITHIETTVSPSNKASRKIFATLSTRLGAPMQESKGYGVELFGGESHEAEPLLRIGPLRGAQRFLDI